MVIGMTESKIEITKLTASDGHILTNGDVYGEDVYLGVNDSAENWHEITMEEYDSIVSAVQEEVE
jgi:hypothetical protein